MLLFCFSLAMGFLAVLNRYIGKTLLYPPAMLCGLWTFLLAALTLCGTYFYSISAETLTVYLVGAISFTLGGVLCLLIPMRCPSPYPEISPYRLRLIRWLSVAGV